MKLLIFSEHASFRKQIEDLLTSTPYPFEAFGLADMMEKARSTSFDGLLVDFESWQRCASVFRYFERLDVLNQKPAVVFSINKKPPALKLRRSKALTLNCPVPVQNEDVYFALQQLSSSLSA